MAYGYANHNTDALAATPTYHNAQTTGHDLADETAPATVAQCLAHLVDLQTKYNAHDADTTAHTTGSLHQSTITIYSYATTPQDYIVEVSDTVLSPVIILSTADCADGRIIIVKDTSGNAGASNIAITTEGAELIDGEGGYLISADYHSLAFYGDGATWHVLISDPQVMPM